MKAGKKIPVVLLSSILICTAYCFHARAAQNKPSEPSEAGKTQAELNGYSEEEWAALMDDTLEYSEIQGLVHNFNPAITGAWSGLGSNTDVMDRAITELKNARRDMEDSADEAKKTGDIAGHMYYSAQKSGMDKLIDGMSKSSDKLKAAVSGTNQPIRKAEAQVASGVKNLMIGYKTVAAQKENLVQLVKLYESSLEASKAMQALGMSADSDMLGSMNSLLSAKAQLSSLEAAENKLYKSLITMCGWKENANPVIGELPQPDEARVAEMNPETDIVKAIGNNYTLIDFRHSSYSKSLGATTSRKLSEEQMEANIKIELENLYSKVLADKGSYEGAKSGYEAASAAMEGSRLKKDMGMLSTAQFLAEEMNYIQKESAYKAAAYTYLQSVESYEAAVAGAAQAE